MRQMKDAKPLTDDFRQNLEEFITTGWHCLNNSHIERSYYTLLSDTYDNFFMGLRYSNTSSLRDLTDTSEVSSLEANDI